MAFGMEITTIPRISLDLLISGTEKATKYRHRNKNYVKGILGQSFALRLKNFSEKLWAKVILEIDEKNVINGLTMGLRGPYLTIEPGGELIITGWKVDEGSGAQFYFAPPDKAYASLMGTPEYARTIKMSAFFELVEEYYRPLKSGNVIPSQLGIGFGKKTPYTSGKHAPASTFFEYVPSRTEEIYYGTPEELEAMGINLAEAETGTAIATKKRQSPGACMLPDGWEQ